MLLQYLDENDATRKIALIQPLLPEPRSGSVALADVLLNVAKQLIEL